MNKYLKVTVKLENSLGVMPRGFFYAIKTFITNFKNLSMINIKKGVVLFMAIKIFIDQGHNPQGFNAGAEGFGLREQDITYNVGKMLQKILNDDDRFEAKTSRNSPNEVLGTNNSSSLAARVNAANSWGANYFISIHVNANTNPNINGSEVYVYQEYTQSYYFGEQILNAVVSEVGTKDNGVRIRPSLYVLRKTTMPAALVELAYITNYDDSQKLKNNQYQFAQAIYSGILKYFGF